MGANCAFARRHPGGGLRSRARCRKSHGRGADLDIFRRLIVAGGRICYLPSALVWHQHRTSTRALAKQVYSYCYGLGAYLAEHLPDRDLRAALRYGSSQATMLLRRTRPATRASQLEAGGKRLALCEACGVMPGALRYWQAARQHRGFPRACDE